MKQSIPEKLKGKTYIDPRTDTGFKNLFASKEAIKDFVDGILHLKGDDQIKDLKYSFDEAIRFLVPNERKISLDAFLTEAEREMTTKEELACCLAYAKRKIAEEAIKEAREEVEEAKEETRKDTKLEMVDAMLANG